jgi:UDP-N-acetyl-D-glucosamine dehydrogenase
VLSECEAVFVCVPTPFDANKTPDLTYVLQAADGIARHIRRGQLIVLQSTTYPGTTEEVMLPRLQQGGLRAGDDFFLAFVPERIDPGVPEHTVKNTPKVVGGVTVDCTSLTSELLSTLGTSVHTVSSPRAAEMTKLLENIFRSVNIALVNELALLSESMGIDIWEVIEAATTKPFGYMAFRPGPGVGGHCIPIDPYYLSWKAREYDFSTRFIELAADINQAMPRHVARLVGRGLGRHGRSLVGADILVLGVAFKPDVDDARNSPAERVIEFLIAEGARVRYHDPHVGSFRVGGNVFLADPVRLSSEPLTAESIGSADAVVILTAHSGIDYEMVTEKARFVVDAVNATRGRSLDVLRLGASHSNARTEHH